MKRQIGGDFTSFLLIIIVVLIVGGIGTLVAWKLGLIPGLGDDDGDGKNDGGGGDGDGNNLNPSVQPPPPNDGDIHNNPSNFQYQTPLEENGFCSEDAGFIRQDVPGCGIICSSKDKVGRQDPKNWSLQGVSPDGADDKVRKDGLSATWYDAQTKYSKIFYGDKESNLLNCMEKAGLMDDGTSGPWSALSPTNMCPSITLHNKAGASKQDQLRAITNSDAVTVKQIWWNADDVGWEHSGWQGEGRPWPTGDAWVYSANDTHYGSGRCYAGNCTEQGANSYWALYCFKPIQAEYNDRTLNSGFSHSKKADSNSDNGDDDGDGDAN